MTTIKRLIHKFLCLLLDHDDDVVETRQHPFACSCHDGGSHGAVKSRCLRCGRERTRLELIC